MANYEIQGPDGKTYEIEAPDIQSATAAFKKFYVPQPLNEDDRETRATNPTLEPASVLPFSKVRGSGEVVFDPTAGILGAITSGVTAPGDVASGKLDPNSPEAIERALDFTALATPLPPGVRAAEAAVPGTLRSIRLGQPKIPTQQELKAAGKAGINEARAMGVDYSPQAVKSMVDDLARSLQEDGLDDITAPKAFSVLAKLRAEPEVGPDESVVVALNNILSLRKSLQKTAGDKLNPSEGAAAGRAIDALDDFVVAADPASVVAGPAAAVAPLVDEARGNFAAQFRSKRVADAITKAERNAAKANSGFNIDNSLRQRLESVLDKDSRGFSKEELKLLNDVVMGKHGANAARWLGNKLGGGGGLASTITGSIGMGLGGIIGGWPGAAIGATALPAVGAASKVLSGQITKSHARALDELIRMRSPLYKKATENPPVLTGLRPEVRAAVMRGLMAGASAQQPRSQGLQRRY